MEQRRQWPYTSAAQRGRAKPGFLGRSLQTPHSSRAGATQAGEGRGRAAHASGRASRGWRQHASGRASRGWRQHASAGRAAADQARKWPWRGGAGRSRTPAFQAVGGGVAGAGGGSSVRRGRGPYGGQPGAR